MATGKLITAAGKAGQAVNDAAYAGYNEVQLRKAWATTRAAINNPASRNVGLAALHQNPTLAMHALAWASTNGDRMARSILSDAGVNEQTLAHHRGTPAPRRRSSSYWRPCSTRTASSRTSRRSRSTGSRRPSS